MGDGGDETVLVVCSANRCRSPLAAAFLRRALAAAGVRVLDAGFADAGLPATGPTLEVAARHGLDLRGHTSTRVGADMVAQADLVVTMERAHVRDLVVAHPDAWAKTFTLKELVRRAEAVGPRVPGQPLADWLATLGEDRRRTDLLGASPLDDVADPTTDPRVDHDTTAAELEALTSALVAVAWPAVAPGL